MVFSCKILFGFIHLVKTLSIFEYCNPDIAQDRLWELDKTICKGKTLWPDRSDLKLCRKHNWMKCAQELKSGRSTTASCSHVSSRCNKTEGGGWPGQCVSNEKLSDQEYSCLDRSDTGASSTSRGNIDFSKMIKCSSDGMKKSEPDGFLCNGKCRERNSWCKSSRLTSHQSGIETCSELDGLSPKDPKLCGNFSFWSEAPACKDFRCNGAYSGQCADSVATLNKWMVQAQQVRYSFDECTGSSLPSSECFSFNTEMKGNHHGKIKVMCEDKSNRIIPMCKPQQFNMSGHSLQFNSIHFNCAFPPDTCNKSETIHPHCRDICEKEKNNTRQKCTCKTPCSLCNSWGIKCPNPEYFWCPGFGPALHPDLVCDQHPQCPNGEDESNCLEEYRKKNMVKKEAHFQCPSSYHPQFVNLEAIRCDGRRECFENIDEVGCKKSIVNYFLIITLIILTGISFLYPRFLNRILKQKQKMELNEILEAGSFSEKIRFGKDDEVLASIQNWHENPSEDYRSSMLAIQAIDFKEKDEINFRIFKTEAKIHDFSKGQVQLCLKNNHSNSTCKAVIESASPSHCIPQGMKNCLTKMMSIRAISCSWFIMKRFLRISLFYLDFLKDSFIILALINLKGFSEVLRYPTEFTSQIILLLLISVFLSIFCASVHIAVNHPLSILGYKNPRFKTKMEPWKLWALRFFIVTHGLIVPAILIDLKEKEENDLKKICEKKNYDKSLRSRELFLNSIKKLILIVKKLELSVEISIQVTISIIMICLQLSKTKTVTGFESVFEADPLQLPGLPSVPSETVLVLSVLASFRSAIFTFLKLKSVERDSFVPMMGKILLAMRCTMALLMRFAVIIIYFTPFMGLMGILAHHKRDLIPFNPMDSVGLEFYEEGTLLSYWYEDEIHTIPWASLYKHFVIYTKIGYGYGDYQRQLCEKPCSDNQVENGVCFKLNGTFYDRSCWRRNGTNTNTQYSDYTGIELQSAYLIFWLIMASHLTITFATKRTFSKQFRKSSVWDKLQHSLNILHIPDVFQEWDEGCDDIKSLQMRWKKSKLEMLVASLVHWATNIALVLPAFLTGLNIIARHEIIVPAIGAYTDEVHAYHKAKLFLWLPPLMVTLASSADFLLFLLYNRLGHPWKELLLKDEILDIPDIDIDTPDTNVANPAAKRLKK